MAFSLNIGNAVYLLCFNVFGNLYDLFIYFYCLFLQIMHSSINHGDHSARAKWCIYQFAASCFVTFSFPFLLLLSVIQSLQNSFIYVHTCNISICNMEILSSQQRLKGLLCGGSSSWWWRPPEIEGDDQEEKNALLQLQYCR